MKVVYNRVYSDNGKVSKPSNQVIHSLASTNGNSLLNKTLQPSTS